MSSSRILGIFAETSIHVGAGQMIGVIDLPVAREVATQYPFIPGSSLKGSLREKVEHQSQEKANRYFGSAESAAGIGVSDGRLLLLPIRSLSEHYRWVTCPYLLERFARDLQLMGKRVELPPFDIEDEQVWVIEGDQQLILEEFVFKAIHKERELTKLAEIIGGLIAHQRLRERLRQSLVVVSDADFSIFAQRGLYIYARNVLDDETKQSKNLWYEEALPADTLLYTILFSRNSEQDQYLAQLIKEIEDEPYLQVGGNETIGQGWTILSSDRRLNG